MRRLFKFTFVGGLVATAVVIGYRLLANRQLDHPVVDGAHLRPTPPTDAVEPSDGEPAGID